MGTLSNILWVSGKRIAWIVPLLLCAAHGWAATLAVTSLSDSGFGSLRTTIASASPGDTIVFAGSFGGQTIHLTSGELAIGINLTIDGSALPVGAKQVAIDGGGNLRVLEITGGNVTLISLILTNGFSGDGYGSGILVDSGAALTVNGSTISGCTATNDYAGGGIYNSGGGSLTLNNCTLSNNSGSTFYGGGIFNSASAIAALNNCTLSGCSSGEGGGIYSYGTLLLNNCTLVGNTSVNGGGGGIDNGNAANAVLNNCTLTGNAAGNSGAGIFTGSNPLVLTNTIVASNTAPYGPDIYGSYSGINNFIGGDPKLAPLGNYGGPTQTMQPLYGSPVIDAGSDSVFSFLKADQRGYTRLSGVHVDIGAAEAQIAGSDYKTVLKNATRLGSEFQFTFTNGLSNIEFTALTSTNLALPLTNWTALGSATQISPGQYQFTDPSATNQARQFYRIVSP